MLKKEFLFLIDNLLQLPAGTISGEEKIDTLEAWDSLVVLNFISLVETKFGLIVAPKDIKSAKTINDLLLLAGKLVA